MWLLCLLSLLCSGGVNMFVPPIDCPYHYNDSSICGKSIETERSR